MNKRKVSVDSNARQRTPTKRPSASSLKARVNMMQQRIRSEKSPSTLNLPHAEPKEPPHNVGDYYVPKTRFTSQDRCKEFATSSPRLKYFPAEKIKKLDNSPAYTADPIGAIIMQQNPQESGTFYAMGTADQNNGQGDTMTSLQPTSQPTSQQRQHQNMHTMSQQQVGGQQTAHQIGQNNSNSEPSLQQQVLSNQVHRPCVPHGERENSPQKTAHPLYRNPPQNATTPGPPNPMQQPLNVSGQTANPETRKAENNGAECPDYDVQPVGGRNAALYRQTMTASQQPRLQSQMSMMPNVSQSNSSQQYQLPVQNHYPPQSQPPRYSTPQNPQLAYQQLQHTMAQQQQLQQRAMAYHMQMMSNDPRKNQENPYGHSSQFVAQAPAQGMTSPQEANKNLSLQNYQAQQRTYATTPRSAQLQPYSINVVNNQPQVFASSTQQQQQQQQQHLMAQQQQHHLMAQHQQPPLQLYRNPGQPLYRNPASANESQQMIEQPGYNEQTSGRQMGQPSQEPPVDSRRDNEQKRTKLSFTPTMIRDQEKMVATMKQQGVPFDVIKRQFESLLNEQRRQLEYIEDLRRQDHMPEVERPVTVTRRRKQTDEKPEWMVHLTPPRLPYIVIEKMYEEQKEKERLAKQMDQSRQIQQNEMTNQLYRHNQQPYQHYRQENRQQPQQMFTKPRAIGSVQSSPNVPMMNYQHYQHQNFPSYQQAQNAYLQQQNPHVQYQQVCQESPQQAERQTDPNNSTAHAPAKRTTEPSSLLKLRMYKERIRPQGRNNGLQDPQIVRKYLEQWSESADVQRGLEYLAGLEQKTRTAKLNGLQERVEADHQLNERLMAVTSQQVPKRIPANGLENGRNPNNPPPKRLTQLKSADHEFLREYPRQKQSNSTNYYVQAERENGTVAVDEQPTTSYGQQHLRPPTPMIPYNERNPTTARYNMMPFRFEGSYPQNYQQMQQYYRNARNLVRNTGEGDTESAQKNLANNVGFDRAGGDATGNMNGQAADTKMPMYRTHYSQPDLHEARTIGGVRYLARKQDYMPNTQLVSPETLIASRNLQPPVIY